MEAIKKGDAQKQADVKSEQMLCLKIVIINIYILSKNVFSIKIVVELKKNIETPENI